MTQSWQWGIVNEDVGYNLGLFSVLLGYFSDLRELINRRVPSSIEPTDHPRMPFADAAKDLVLKPFENITNTNMNRSVKKLHWKKKNCFHCKTKVHSGIAF